MSQARILLLCGVMAALWSGCYQETRRSDVAWDLDEEPEATSRPSSLPVEPAPLATEPVASAPSPTETETPKADDVGRKIRAIIETNFGHMEAELWPDVAPETVANFVRLAKAGFYDNMPCHRMLPGFVVQFGEPTDDAKKAALKPIKGEFSESLKHEAGTLSMARQPSYPDSATSQFYICFRPKTEAQQRWLSSLDGKYAIFGKVVRGLTILDGIEAVPTTQQARGPAGDEPSKPTKTILLRTVRIVE
ncbi:MAG: peptidylprolyl isomerase [Phycisphaerae bacterium]|nr:peptidylprolyl isomerase [Phycisphaerae bacterium]